MYGILLCKPLQFQVAIWMKSPLYYEIDAQDAVSLMKDLGFQQFSLLGWCEGGTCAIITAAEFQGVIKNVAIWGHVCFCQSIDVELFAIQGMYDWDPKFIAKAEGYYGKELAERWEKLFIIIVTLQHTKRQDVKGKMIAIGW